MKGRRWTPSELQFLKDHREMEDEYLAKKLGRTIFSIRDKKHVLRIRSDQMGVYMPEILSQQEKLARIYKKAADLGVRIGERR